VLRHHRRGLVVDRQRCHEAVPRYLLKILQYFAEARGLGVSICAAAQASSQLDVVYGGLQGRTIRDVVPVTLIMYGAHEEELMRSAAFWAGKTSRSHQSYGHNSDDRTTSRQFGNALEPEELSRATSSAVSTLTATVRRAGGADGIGCRLAGARPSVVPLRSSNGRPG
jgi:hypothetical protein